MAIKSTIQSGAPILLKFPLLMSDNANNVYLVTHDQEVGLRRILISCNSSLEKIGDSRVIDDLELSMLNRYGFKVTLENL